MGNTTQWRLSSSVPVTKSLTEFRILNVEFSYWYVDVVGQHTKELRDMIGCL